MIDAASGLIGIAYGRLAIIICTYVWSLDRSSPVAVTLDATGGSVTGASSGTVQKLDSRSAQKGSMPDDEAAAAATTDSTTARETVFIEAPENVHGHSNRPCRHGRVDNVPSFPRMSTGFAFRSPKNAGFLAASARWVGSRDTAR